MNIKHFLSIALAMTITLVSIGCHAESSDRKSKYEITFTEFKIIKAHEWYRNSDSEYLFYAYDSSKKIYVYECNGIKGCVPKKNNLSTKIGDKVALDLTVSDVTDYVDLMVLEKDKYNFITRWNGWNVLSKTDSNHQIKLDCKFSNENWLCLQIPVQYLLNYKNSCLTMATENGSDEICLSYKIKEINPKKLHSNFEQNLKKLSALSDLFKNLPELFKNDSRYNNEQPVKLFDFSKPHESVSSVTFYYGQNKEISGLPTKIAKPVLDYIADKYPTGLWVINDNSNNVLAAYDANKLFTTTKNSSPSISVNWPQNISDKSINDWLKTPEKGQVYRPYHTITLFYKIGHRTLQRTTNLRDNTHTVSKTLNLPGRYSLGTHLEIYKVKLSGIFSFLDYKIQATSINFTYRNKRIKAQLNLPDGYKYHKKCRQISKTVSQWFKTNKVKLQCPRLPKSLIVPEFNNGDVLLDAQNQELSLRLRFQNRKEQSSLKNWKIGNSTISEQGADGWMLINASNLPLPEGRILELIPPKEAFSIYYLNQSIKIKLSNPQYNYLYTAKSVPELDGFSEVDLNIPNPKLRQVKAFKDSKNPWTPEKLTFLCDGTQSDISLCGKTCALHGNGISCEGKEIEMPLKNLNGYLITSNFLGERWSTNSVLLKKQSLTDFFCGAWQRLFPLHNHIIVVGKNQHSVQVAYFTNTESNTLLLSGFTENKKPVWSYGIKHPQKLSYVDGDYDYYLHKDYAAKNRKGDRLKLPIREDLLCKNSNQSSESEDTISISSPVEKIVTSTEIPRIDIVAVFANNYNYQQETFAPIKIPGLDIPGLDIPKATQKDLKTGWMRIWNKPDTEKSLRSYFSKQYHKSIVLHHFYDDNNDRKDQWLLDSELKDMKDLVNISDVVLHNTIRPRNRNIDEQITKIIKRVKNQWKVNGDYLLVILSDGISKQEMEQLNNIELPRGNGKRRLVILTSDFLPVNSQSFLTLPHLPSNTGPHTVISMYDKNWVQKFVKAMN